MEIISTWSILIFTYALLQYTSHYFCQLPISCHLPICLQQRDRTLSLAVPEKKNQEVHQDHTRQKRKI